MAHPQAKPKYIQSRLQRTITSCETTLFVESVCGVTKTFNFCLQRESAHCHYIVLLIVAEFVVNGAVQKFPLIPRIWLMAYFHCRIQTRIPDRYCTHFRDRSPCNGKSSE